MRDPRIAITLGDPRGIGPEIVQKVLADPPGKADYFIIGDLNPGSVPKGKGQIHRVEVPALQQSGGIWFGWSGEVEDTVRTAPGVVADGQITLATVDLSRKDFDEYYIGYANRVLWPLFHCRSSLVQLRWP